MDMYRCRSLVRLALGLCLFLPVAPIATAAIDPSAPLVRALDALRRADTATRARFVELAVDALVARHRALLHGNVRDPSWSQGTREYIARLEGAAAAARRGARVLLINDPGQGLRVIVGQRPARQFALVPPRPSERGALERDVLARLCLEIDCSAPAPAPAPHRPLPQLPAVAGASTPVDGVLGRKPRADGVLETLPSGGDGLSCARGDGRHRKLLDRACASVLAEVRALAEALHTHARAGHVLDWALLERGAWRTSGAVLATASDGSAVTLSAPILARYPAIYGAALPWIRARLTGKVLATAIAPPAPLLYAVRPELPPESP